MSAPTHSPPTDERSPEPVDEALRHLARMLDFAAPGRFVLAFVKCSLPAQLNLSRELFRRDVPCPPFIWLPDHALTKVAQGAPDFWAWRSGVYEFPPEPETAQRMARMSVYDEAGHVTSSLSAEAKRERLRLLARLRDDYRELGDGPRERSTQPDILWKIGSVHQDLGEWAEARALYEEALELARALDEPKTAAGLLHQLGRLAQVTGDLAEARRLYDQSLEIERELGDKRGIAQTQHQLGRLAVEEGNLAEAARLFEESLKLLTELGSPDANVARQSLERVMQRIDNRFA